MVLMKCPECGKEISDKATSCPNCGCPITDVNISNRNNPSNSKANLFFVLAIITCVIWVICWYYEASHGVRLAEEEIYYTVTNYKSTTFIFGRICAVLKPVCIIAGLIFVTIGILKKKRII